MKKCPYCSEDIQDTASKCRYCGEWLKDSQNETQNNSPIAENYSAQQNTPSGDVEVATVKYAGFWIRYAAYVIDLMIASILADIVYGFFLVVLKANRLGAFFSYCVIFFGYFIILTYKKGTTRGKTSLRLKVISSKKEKLSLKQVIIRETIGKIISSLILGIGYIMAGFTDRKQALHDKLASTYVVYEDPKIKTKTWITVISVIHLILIVVAIIGILVSIMLTMTK